MMLSQSRLR
uniref:Uncharacterized protein n=1 Tax=Anguilla anguilla TaxID=7936 RepID=A0A0E9XQH1_ANGAN